MTAAQGRYRARYRRILRFASGMLLQLAWYELLLPRLGLRRVSDRSRTHRMQQHARRFYALAVNLGGLMIKVGQFMSARLDVLPPEIVEELRGLQDEVPAEPFDDIRIAAEAGLGMSLDRAFLSFDRTPIAAASLGQVHRARLAPEFAADVGFADVVVKVQRPGIDDIVEVDLAALRRIGGWLSRIRLVSDRMDAPALVAEFAQTSREEVDYVLEGRNAERFGENVAENPRVGAPVVVWERTARQVLTLQNVAAIKIDDRAAIRAAGVDPAEVAQSFATAMFEQVFRHAFFHGDPHAGNVFFTPLPGVDAQGRPNWEVTFIDFGMMGEISPELRAGLRSVVLSVVARDSGALIRAIEQLGVLLPAANTLELEKALSGLFGRFGGMGFEQLRAVDPREFAAFASDFMEIIPTLPVQLPEGMLLLFRALSLTSGLSAGIDPHFNMWDAVQPHAETLLREESSHMVRRLGQDAMKTAGVLWQLPGRVDGFLTRLERGSLQVDTSQIERRLGRLERLIRRVMFAVLFAALLVGGVMLLPVNQPLGIVMMSASVLPLLPALFARGRPR